MTPQQNILVLNLGSSSLKFAVIQPQSGHVALSGLAERLGNDARFEYKLDDKKHDIELAKGAVHKDAISTLISTLEQQNLLTTLAGVGHRVVHGGETFSESMLITQENIEKLDQLNHLAPLHNPVNMEGIHSISELLPQIHQVAVFDTAFHQTMEDKAYLYALPYELYEQHGIRRYGFHGTSYRYVSQKAAQQLGISQADSQFLIAHLGNGCSACAVKNGESIDTSMGLTPLEGLPMGTRSGDLDPGLSEYLNQQLDMTQDDIMTLYNKQSGLLGISGISNDMRTIQQHAEKGDKRANLAIELFAYKIARYLGALATNLDRIDALVFTGGIGENDALTRSLILEQLGILGFKLDGELNQQNGDDSGRITSDNSTLAMVVATNEEMMIAQDTQSIIAQLQDEGA